MSPRRPSDLISAAHRTVARMVGTALALHDRLSYAALAHGLVEHLPPERRHGLAWAALHACAPDKAWAVATERLRGHEGDGPPDPPDWIGELDPAWIMDDAMTWAGAATPFQRRAYAMACLAHMEESEREAIVRSLQGRTG